jgi:PAS domain S-box-containing protein
VGTDLPPRRRATPHSPTDPGPDAGTEHEPEPEHASEPRDPARPLPARTPLERLADQRLRLQVVATALAESLDPHEVATHIVEAACVILGAPLGWAAATTSDGAAVELLQSIGYPAEVTGPWARVPVDLPVPMTEVVRTGRPLFHASAAARTIDFPALAGRDATPPVTEGSAVVPLAFEGRTTGALAVAFLAVHEFDADERWFLMALAALGSQALERARLFEALRDRDERLRFALQASGTGTWAWDPGTNRLEWSPEMFELHGMEVGAEPDFDQWLGLLDPNDRAGLEGALAACLRDGGPFDEESRVHRPDGTVRWVHSVGRLIPSGTGRSARLIGTSRDTTDRKVAEEQRDRHLESERDAARLRDAFIGIVSHELRTPITTIFGGTRVLARRWREMDPQARDDLLGDVVGEADRLYRLVEDLLVLTRVERGTIDAGDEPVHLGRVLARVVASEEAGRPGVRFNVTVAPGLPTVIGEDAYLEQILRNLLANAAKYGGEGSTVTVEAKVADGDDGVEIRVRDEGPGIDEAESEAVFNLFYRSPRTAGRVAGAGIGLFVCRQLAAAMGGYIRAERAVGGGAALVVTLPRSHDDDPD